MTPLRAPRWMFVSSCVVVAAGLAGCFTGMSRKTERSSSVVAFLYPRETNPVPPTAIPVLRVPLRVGIAFVPSGSASDRGYYTPDSDLSEMQKSALLQRVATEFRGREYIESIEIVPTNYLRPAGGFENLEQVRRMLNFDVVALVAYDQVQFTNENFFPSPTGRWSGPTFSRATATTRTH